MHLLRSPVMSASAARGGGHAGTACAALVAVRQFAANDEICREFADDGALFTSLIQSRARASLRDPGHDKRDVLLLLSLAFPFHTVCNTPCWRRRRPSGGCGSRRQRLAAQPHSGQGGVGRVEAAVEQRRRQDASGGEGRGRQGTTSFYWCILRCSELNVSYI